MNEDFSGKTALVTGASRGIGYGIARELLSRGAAVTITGRKADQLAEAAKQLEADTGNSRVLALQGNAGDDRPARRSWPARSRSSAAWTCWSTTPASTRSTAS